MMKKFAVATALGLGLMAGTAQAAFVVGGENGWQLSTDGIVDVFATYQTVSPKPSGSRSISFLGDPLLGSPQQHFSVQVGLLPSVVGLNIKAPTTNGIDSTVRIGIYPSIQNSSNGGNRNRFETNPNIDFREIYYTAKGKCGELLAGRALNLYQGKSILTDMTLLTAGTVPTPATTTTLGHIGYGYLYTNFGPQLRYTTPDMNGIKVAVSVNEPYDVSSQGGDKTPTPRFETEISYATVLGNGTSVQAWGSALYQGATMSSGHHVRSVGGSLGGQVVIKGLEIHGSGYYGEGLGMISAQDGSAFNIGDNAGGTDALGEERTHFGFLGQVTYQLTPTIKLGANYGQNRQNQTNADKLGSSSLMKKQESAVAMVVYNLNKFTQFIAEYGYAQNTWQDRATQHSNNVNIGTMFYW